MRLYHWLFMFFSLVCLGQNESIKVVKQKSMAIEADRWIGFDKFGYQYTITRGVLQKTQKNELFEYKNLSYGKITKVDIQNPLKIVVFFEPFNAVVTLDNQLNETQRILFSDLPQPLLLVAMGFAAQNKLWGFDRLSQRLLLYDFIKNTPQFLGPPREEQLIYHQTTLNFFYWIDQKQKLQSCDIFGKTTLIGTVEPFEKCWIVNSNNLILYNQEKFYWQDIASSKLIELKIDEKNVQNFTFKDGILSIFTPKELFNYQIILP
jgi:hypothetical protein